MTWTTPWWAIGLLNYDPRSERSRIRSISQQGQYARIARAGYTQLWEEIVREGRVFAEKWTLDELVEAEPERCREAALLSPRAFVQFCRILDDASKVPELKDFHVQGIRVLRQSPQGLLLWPFQHGKSWISSIVVPLMDWCEERESTQGRVYLNETFAKFWTRKLASNVQFNESLHALFPWVDKPGKQDPCDRMWNTKQFSIKGKSIVEPSWEALTYSAGFTGRRYWRAIMDDWVNSENCASESIQERMWDTFTTGVLTLRQHVPYVKKPFRTRFGTIGVVGTLYDKRDINSKVYRLWKNEPSAVVKKVDVYPHPHSRRDGEVVWPEERPYDYIIELEKQLGPRAFAMRCRNQPLLDGETSFPAEAVEEAVRSEYEFGVPPPNSRCVIGFDPASGRKGRRAKFPAAVVLAFVEDYIHVVEWHRWALPMPRQCDQLADLAARFSCPVVVEDNHIQNSYVHWLNRNHYRVQVWTHTTTQNKRDWAQGVESWIPYFEDRKIIIHSGRAPWDMVHALKTEFIDWPQGQYTDLVMAAWVAKYQWYLHNQIADSARLSQDRAPAYARVGSGMVIDLASIRQGMADLPHGGTPCPHCERFPCACPYGTRIWA